MLFVVVVVVVGVVAVLACTRIVKSVVTGQAPVTLEWHNTPAEYKQTFYTPLDWGSLFFFFEKVPRFFGAV